MKNASSKNTVNIKNIGKRMYIDCLSGRAIIEVAKNPRMDVTKFPRMIMNRMCFTASHFLYMNFEAIMSVIASDITTTAKRTNTFPNASMIVGDMPTIISAYAKDVDSRIPAAIRVGRSGAFFMLL